MRKYVLFIGSLLAFALVATACGGAAGNGSETPPTPTEQPTETGPVVRPGPWDAPPPSTIDPNAIYVATLVTEKGNVKVELFADRAPITVNNFIFLAEQGFYNDITFHRVIPGFMAQSGDPTGSGLYFYRC